MIEAKVQLVQLIILHLCHFRYQKKKYMKKTSNSLKSDLRAAKTWMAWIDL